MSRLKNLYTHLVKNRFHELQPWYDQYVSFTKDIGTIRSALEKGGELTSSNTYNGTAFAKENEPWNSFARRLLYQDRNGIAAYGQSTLSNDNCAKLIAADNFRTALKEVILETNPDTIAELELKWKATTGQSRPLRINRIAAACTLDVSTTADTGKFAALFCWLTDKEKIIEKPSCESSNWYKCNVYLTGELRNHFAEELKQGDTNHHLLNIFIWEMFTHIADPFSLRKQIVRYGAPGTGKTYTARQDAKLQFQVWQSEFDPEKSFLFTKHIHTVQFHPSYGYEDFMEGIRPILIDGKAELRLQNGSFKSLCIEAGKWETELATKVSIEVAEQWNELKIEELRKYRNVLSPKNWDSIFENKDDVKLRDAIPPYFLIIDEINRAELSRVLGELMLCLENRGVGGAIQTQYSTLNDDDTCMLKQGTTYKFFVPHNLYVIGTMNTIDRSVESFDFALRRRFKWERVDPNPDVLRFHLIGKKREAWLPLVEGLTRLNNSIREEPLLGADYQIGHAYLMNLNYSDQLTLNQVQKEIWKDFIQPLIEEYLRGTGREESLLSNFRKSFKGTNA